MLCGALRDIGGRGYNRTSDLGRETVTVLDRPSLHLPVHGKRKFVTELPGQESFMS
jgi:hypothetical protein